jgi:murein DD-endopeptidase MepM/ murein hydrolase activator NlpD
MVLFVASAVLLGLDAFLPFPSPAERVLSARGDPSDWALLFPRSSPRDQREGRAAVAGDGPRGGYSPVQPPLTVMLYRVKPGDSITGIAQKLGLNPDSISSMNRPEGRGVHLLAVGELVRVPSQDGIFLALASDFDAQCQKYGVSPEDVLAANQVTRGELSGGMKLFFPGVQHKGYEYSLSLGVAVINPLRGGWESSAFGYRADPFTGERRKHRGVDIAAPFGTTVKSASDGVVRYAGWDEMLGNYVEVKGPMGYSYVYGHLSRVLVRTGRFITWGGEIGLVGDTGYATGPHLHFEVRKNGVPQNPSLFVSGIR